MTSTIAPETPSTKQRTKSGYQVLKLVDFPDTDDGAITRAWMTIGNPIEAANAEAAIRERTSTEGGTYLAIPARSFRPVTVKVDTKTVVSFNNA